MRVLTSYDSLGFVWLQFTHNLYMKEFGVILGLLMGASRGALQQRPESQQGAELSWLNRGAARVAVKRPASSQLHRKSLI